MAKFDIMALKPATTPDYMVQAWLDFLHWAVGEPEIVAAFRRDTGIMWTPGRTAIDRMIDKATDADRKFFEAFIPWANEKLWGDI